MEKQMNDRVRTIRSEASNQEAFMKQLAEVDEEGALTDAVQQQINGGTGILDTIIYLGGYLLGKR